MWSPKNADLLPHRGRRVQRISHQHELPVRLVWCGKIITP